MASKKHGVRGNERSMSISLLTSRKKKCRKCAIGATDTSGVNGDEVEVSDKAKVLKKGPWTAEEDGMLIKYVKSDGERNWKNVQKTGLMRCGKSCRLRWTNHLRPDLKKGPFSFEEEKIVVQLHQKLGNRWSKIAAKLPGRTDNEVKNFWNTKIKKRIANDSLEISEQNSSSPQQNEVNQTPSNLTLVNSPTPQNPHMNLNPNPSINPQTTFPHFNPTNEPSFEHGVTPLRSSTMHKDPIMSFPNNFSNQFNSFDESEYQHNLSFAQNVSRNSSLNNQVPNPFPRTHLLDFGTNSAYYYPNPLPETQMSFESSTIVLPSIQAQTNPSGSTYNHRGFLGYLFGDDMWSDSLSFEPDITLRYDPENDGGMTPFVVGIGNDKRSFFNGGNCYYEKHSKFEVKPVPEEEVLEDYTGSIDDELLSLLNTFTNDGSPPELHLAIGGENMVENTTSSYSHFYLDQPLYAFTSFSGAMDVFASRSDSIPSTSSDLNRYIDGGECV